MRATPNCPIRKFFYSHYETKVAGKLSKFRLRHHFAALEVGADGPWVGRFIQA